MTAVWDFDAFEMPDDDRRFIVRPMITTSQATDLFLGDLVRRGYSDRTVETYRRLLDKFCDRFPNDQDVSKVTIDDCRRFLDTYNRKTIKKGETPRPVSAGTRAHVYSVLSSFFGWLYKGDKIKRNPLDRLERPRRLRAQDLNVVSVTREDVQKMLEAAKPGAERLAVYLAVCTGARRRALARLRLSDYNRATKKIRFQEKGGKTIEKALTWELVNVLEAAIADGTIQQPDGYLIPAQGGLSRVDGRDDRVVWRLVKDVAARAGVEAHVHALRAAFACFYLEQHPGDTEALKELLGHASIATTEIYLRKLDKGAAMERVRTLSWSDNGMVGASPQIADELLASLPVVGAGGFEPPSNDSRASKRTGSQRDGKAT